MRRLVLAGIESEVWACLAVPRRKLANKPTDVSQIQQLQSTVAANVAAKMDRLESLGSTLSQITMYDIKSMYNQVQSILPVSQLN
jgi:hypothetical protein